MTVGGVIYVSCPKCGIFTPTEMFIRMWRNNTLDSEIPSTTNAGKMKKFVTCLACKQSSIEDDWGKEIVESLEAFE